MMSTSRVHKAKMPTVPRKAYQVLNEPFAEDETVFNAMTAEELAIFKENSTHESQTLSDDSSVISTKPTTPDNSPKKRAIKRGRKKRLELEEVEKILSSGKKRGRKARKVSADSNENSMQVDDDGCEKFTLEVVPQGIPKREFRYQNTHKYGNRRGSGIVEKPTLGTPKKAVINKSQSTEVKAKEAPCTPSKLTLSRSVSVSSKTEPRTRCRSSTKNQFDIDNVVVVSESRHHPVDTKNWENNCNITTPEFRFVKSDCSKIAELEEPLSSVCEMIDDGESSDEDTSDEAYMERHDPKEKEERVARHADEEDKRLEEQLQKSKKRRESQLNREMKAAAKRESLKKIVPVKSPVAVKAAGARGRGKSSSTSKKACEGTKQSLLKKKVGRKGRTPMSDEELRDLLTIKIKLPISEHCLPILV